jgi:hypothetical protein
MKISTRSTAALTDYVKTTDRLRAIETERKELELREKALRPIVLAEIGTDPRPVTIRGALRIVRAGISQSVSIVDAAAALDFARSHGLKTTPPKPERVETTTLRSLALSGSLPEGICSIEQKPIIIVE